MKNFIIHLLCFLGLLLLLGAIRSFMPGVGDLIAVGVVFCGLWKLTE